MCLDSGGSGLGCSQHHRWPGSLAFYRHSSPHSFFPSQLLPHLFFSNTLFVNEQNECLPKSRGCCVVLSVTVYVLHMHVTETYLKEQRPGKEKKAVLIVFSIATCVFKNLVPGYDVLSSRLRQLYGACEFCPPVSLMCVRS